MKKYIIIPILLSLFIFVGCVEDLPTTSMVEIEPGSTYLSLRSTEITVPVAGGVQESITLKSLRILVFKKEGEQIVTNKKFDITNVDATDQGGGIWIADFSEFVAPTNPGLSVVYAVLNEDVTEVSGQSLTSALNGITTLDSMQALVNTPLTYTPLRVVFDEDTGKPIEPPFVMVAYDEFTIPDNRPITDPFTADLRGLGEDSKGFAMDRTMAKVTISKVTSDPFNSGYVGTTDKVKTSYIHILEMGLVDVPETYLWSRPNNLVPYDGLPQSFTFDLPTTNPPGMNYYSRTWGPEGSITATASSDVTWEQKGKPGTRIYKVLGNAGSNAFKYEFNNTYYGLKNNDLQMNSGIFLKELTNLLNIEGVEFEAGNLKYTNTAVTANVTGDYWTLDEENISFYVPENILNNPSDTVGSTKLHVKAAVASIQLDTTKVDFSIEDVTWDVTDPLPNWSFPSGYTDDLINKARRFYPKYKYLEVDSINPDYVSYLKDKETGLLELVNKDLIGVISPTDPEGLYIHFWDASSLTRIATGKITNMPLEDPDFSIIKDKDGNILNTKDFYLPIKNNVKDIVSGISEDYNIYRNHEYKFSVHVLKQWETAAPQGAPIPQASTRSTSVDPNESMVIRIVPE